MNTSVRTLVASGLIAASLGAALPTVASEGTPSAGLGALEQAHPHEAYVQYYRRYRRGPSGGAVAAGVIGGLAAGALIGGLAAQAQPGPAYGFGGGGPGAPVGNVYGQDPNYVSYCASKYRSFDPVSGTYLARDGYRYPCE